MSAEQHANKNQPAIRFKGFSGEWEEKTFSSIALRVTFFSGNEDLPRLEYEDINSGQGTLNKNIFEKESNKFGIEFNQGDVLFGKLRPYLKNWYFADFTGLAVGDFWVLRSTKGVGCFLYYLIQTKPYDDIANQSTGTKMPRSDWGLVSNSIFKITDDAKEQTQIGECFQQLDRLVAQHQQKHDKLKQIKKALLEKMFPQQGATQPQIRFKGFSGDWEEKALGEIGDSYSGLSGKTKDDFGHGNARYVTYMNVFSNSVTNPLQVDAVEIDRTQNEVNEGDVLFTTSSETPDEVGMSSVWVASSENIYLNSFCFGYRPKVVFDNYFLANNLRAPYFRRHVVLLAQGISRYNISKNKTMSLSIKTPELAEQTQIGNFFQQLDTLIKQQHTQLTQLNNIKQSLLNKMFV